MDIEREAWQVYATLVAGGVAVVPTNAGYGLLARPGLGRDQQSRRCGAERPRRLLGTQAGTTGVSVLSWLIRAPSG